MFATMAERMPGFRGLPAREMIEQVRFAVLDQLDLTREAGMLELLVMEFLDGLERFGPGSFTRDERSDIVQRILQAVYRMLFVDGLVHCDLHPGNLYLRRTGEVVLLDAGFVVELSPEVRLLFAEFFLNMALGRAWICADVVLESALAVPPGADVTGFRRDLAELVLQNHGRRAGEFRLGPFAARLFDLQRRYRISADPAFVFPLLSLLVLEGMINDFDVSVDFQAESLPTLLQALRG
jgi:ubiquinone biosynthesis protein